MERTDRIPMNISDEGSSNRADDGPREEQSDREVVALCQQGQLDAYEILVSRYRQKVYGLALSMVRNEADATDIAQDAFVRAWNSIGKFKRNASFYTWIYRITTNLCIDFARKRKRQPTAEFEETIERETDANVVRPPSSNPSPRLEAERGELRQQIDEALAQLSPDHRAVIQLREFEGMDYATMAKALKCSIGTVMSRLHYARKHLQALLGDAL